MPPQNNQPRQSGQLEQPGQPNQSYESSDLPIVQQPASPSKLPAVPQVINAQGPAGQLPVASDNDPNTPRPSQDQQVSQQGNVSIQHAPGKLPQYGYQAPESLRPLNVNPVSSTSPDDQTNDSADDPTGKRYAFFLDEHSKPKSKLGFVTDGSKRTKIIVLAVLSVVLLIAGAVIVSSLGSSDAEDTSGTYAGIILDQQEILRINTLAQPLVDASSLKYYIPTAQTTIGAAQAELITYAGKHNKAIFPKALSIYKANPKTDEALAAAQASGTYDATFTSLMGDILNNYQADLQQIRTTTTDPAVQGVISKDYDGATLLIKMLATQ